MTQECLTGREPNTNIETKEYGLNWRQTDILKPLAAIIEGHGKGKFTWKESPETRGTEFVSNRLEIEGDAKSIELVDAVLSYAKDFPLLRMGRQEQGLIEIFKGIREIASRDR